MKEEIESFQLNDGERVWLKALLEKNFEEINVNELKLELWDQLPKLFNVENIDQRLIREDTWITALGIWFIDPENEYLNWLERSILFIKEEILKGNLKEKVSSSLIEKELNISEKDSEIILRLMYDLNGFFGSGSVSRSNYSKRGMSYAELNRNKEAYDEFLNFNTLKEKLEHYFINSSYLNKNYIGQLSAESAREELEPYSEVWKRINKEYGLSKRKIGLKISFVEEKFKREIIFRDIKDAYLLSEQDFHKSAVLLAGSIIEELLRLYLLKKEVPLKRKQFYYYLEEAEKHQILNKAISNLSDSVRHFRNYVHLEKEKDIGDTIIKSHSKSAISSMFSLIESFKKIDL